MIDRMQSGCPNKEGWTQPEQEYPEQDKTYPKRERARDHKSKSKSETQNKARHM